LDTRSKILSPAGAGGLSGPLVCVTGYFDLLLAEHARELSEVRKRTPDCRLLVIVLPHPGELHPIDARAELAAALRMVDYVVIADRDPVEVFITRLRPVEVVRLETAEAGRTRRLIDHVHRGQTR
jgi:bifunctional ADP-heptose synthase (sugar kinase/adenylyltransferase)